MTERLVRFSGRPSIEMIANGMNAVRRNASRLASDAKACLQMDRHAAAAGLAVLSIEESGKDQSSVNSLLHPLTATLKMFR
jgi:AbiV family abortive infection protein